MCQLYLHCEPRMTREGVSVIILMLSQFLTWVQRNEMYWTCFVHFARWTEMKWTEMKWTERPVLCFVQSVQPTELKPVHFISVTFVHAFNVNWNTPAIHLTALFLFVLFSDNLQIVAYCTECMLLSYKATLQIASVRFSCTVLQLGLKCFESHLFYIFFVAFWLAFLLLSKILFTFIFVVSAAVHHGMTRY